MSALAATLDAERALLLAACSVAPVEEKRRRIQTLIKPSIQWNNLFDLAEHHRVQPLLHQTFAGMERSLPPAEIRSLKQTFQTNLHKTLLLSRELIRLLVHLSNRNIEVLPYKGPALAETIYGDIVLRQSSDIDMLIHRRDLPRIREAVRELGYTPHLPMTTAEERAYLKSGYECAFDGPAGPNLLELQWAILPHFYAVDFDMNGLFQRASNITVAGQPMKSLSLDDLFIVLALHAAKHAWGRLIWLCDLARVISLPGLNWSWIGSQAKDLGILRILRVTMLLAHRLLDVAIPAAAEENISEDPAATALAEEIAFRISSGAAWNVESLAYFRLMMRLRERPSDQLRFLQRLTLTPGPGEWQAVRLPQPLHPLYRVVRLSRLAARFVRT